MLNKDHSKRIGWMELFEYFFPGEDRETTEIKIMEERYENRRS